jgi:hypothetical protein
MISRRSSPTSTPICIPGKQAQRIVCAAADIERFAVTLKTLPMRRVDQTNAWKQDGARSPQGWLADKTGTTMSDASGTVELGEQLEQLPEIAAAAKNGQLSPGKTRMIAGAASQNPTPKRNCSAWRGPGA